MKGVYGIYVDGELVYVGKTIIGFDERFEAHQGYILSKSWSKSDMYKDLELDLLDGKHVYM